MFNIITILTLINPLGRYLIFNLSFSCVQVGMKPFVPEYPERKTINQTTNEKNPLIVNKQCVLYYYLQFLFS